MADATQVLTLLGDGYVRKNDKGELVLLAFQVDKDGQDVPVGSASDPLYMVFADGVEVSIENGTFNYDIRKVGQANVKHVGANQVLASDYAVATSAVPYYLDGAGNAKAVVMDDLGDINGIDITDRLAQTNHSVMYGLYNNTDYILPIGTDAQGSSSGMGNYAALFTNDAVVGWGDATVYPAQDLGGVIYTLAADMNAPLGIGVVAGYDPTFSSIQGVTTNQGIGDDYYPIGLDINQAYLGGTILANQSNAPGSMPSAALSGYGAPIDSETVGDGFGGDAGLVVNAATGDGFGNPIQGYTFNGGDYFLTTYALMAAEQFGSDAPGELGAVVWNYNWNGSVEDLTSRYAVLTHSALKALDSSNTSEMLDLFSTYGGLWVLPADEVGDTYGSATLDNPFVAGFVDADYKVRVSTGFDFGSGNAYNDYDPGDQSNTGLAGDMSEPFFIPGVGAVTLGFDDWLNGNGGIVQIGANPHNREFNDYQYALETRNNIMGYKGVEVGPDNPIDVKGPQAFNTSGVIAITGIITIGVGKILQNFTVGAIWDGSPTADTFTATLEGSFNGTYAGADLVILKTLNAGNLNDSISGVPYPYTRLNLSALSLVTATGINLVATGAF